MKFGRGCIPDPVGHRVSGAHLRLGALRAPQQASNSLEGKNPPIGNQRVTNRCTGWGFGGSYQTTFLPSAGGWVVSAGGIYTLGRCIDRYSVNVRLEDVGAEPNQVGRAGVEWGFPREVDWPTTDENVNDEPTEPQLSRAGFLTVGACNRVNETDIDAKISRWCALIDAGIAPAFDVFVDDAHDDWDGSGVLEAPDSDITTNHMVYGVGYEDYGRTIKWAGSYGVGWGRAGYGVGTADFLRAASLYFFRAA